jgi:hypothetical protein
MCRPREAGGEKKTGRSLKGVRKRCDSRLVEVEYLIQDQSCDVEKSELRHYVKERGIEMGGGGRGGAPAAGPEPFAEWMRPRQSN